MAGEEKNPKVWPKEATEASDFDFLMVGNEDDPIMKIYKDKLNEVIVVQGESMPAVQGGATSATAVALVAGPTGQNRYFDASWGFWKYNNVVLKNPLGTDGIPQGNDGTLYWDGTALTWKISKMQELKAVEGVDVIDPDGVGVPKEKAVALYVEPIKQKIDYAIESDLEFSPTVTTGDAETRSYETREFTGWGGILGKPQDFDHINIAKIKWTQAGFPITEVNVTLRDTSYTGTILADKKVPFSGAINEVNDLLIDFPLITNADKKNIWYEVRTNGRLSRANALTVIGAKYSTATSIATRFSTSSGDVADGIGYFVEVGAMVPKPKPTAEFIQAVVDGIPVVDDNYAIINIPRHLYALTGDEFNIYFDNLVFSNIPVDQLVIDIESTKGRHMNRRFLYSPIVGDAGTVDLTVSVSYNQKVLTTKTVKLHTVLSTTSGSRKVIIVGDSTASYVPAQPSSSTLMPRLYGKMPAAYTATFVGTKGYTNMMNEAFGGAQLLDHTTAGRTLYKFIISGVTNTPAFGDAYSNNGSTYVVIENNVNSGSGYISCLKSGTNNPTASGVLTKTSGVGDAVVNFSSFSVTSGTGWWNPTTNQLDVNYYYANSGITLASGDWVITHLMINDIAGVKTDADMESLLIDRKARMHSLINAFKAATPGIRFGICITIPPAISQDAFGVAYSNSIDLKRYYRNVQMTQKAFLEEFDTTTNEAANVFVIGLHLGLDRRFNFPHELAFPNARNTEVGDKIFVYSNAVHPDDPGTWQMADMIWAFLLGKESGV